MLLAFLAMILVDELQIMDLNSSFGPLGRHKIISNDSGSIVITKDGQMIANSIVFPSETPFLELIRKDLVAGAEKSGDGVITASMLVLHALKSIDERLAASYNSRARIRLLRVSEVLWSVVSQHQTGIVAALVGAGLWTKVGDKKDRIVNIVRSVVTPSSNSSVAADVADILTSWLLFPDENALSDQCLSVLCKKILRNFDTLVHVAVGQQQSPSTQLFSFTAESEVLLRGRCRDHSALSLQAGSMGGVEFVCIVHLLPQKQALRAHTVRLSSTHHALNMHTVGRSAVEALAKYLQPPAGTTRVIFCCDSVGDDVIQSLANNQMYLVDCIPPDYLTYIAKRSNSAMYLSPEDVLLSTESATGTQWGTFHHLERLIFGTRSEVFFRLCGVKTNKTEQEEKEGGAQRGVPLQLILRGASSLSVGVHVSMLKRALKAVSFSLGGSLSSSASSPLSSLSCATSDACLSDVVVSGAGAGELGWSILWRQVGRKIATCTADSAAQSSSEPPPLITSTPAEALLKTFEEKIAPLVGFLSDRIVQRLGTVHADALCECAPLCELLSTAYLQVPLQCIANSADVLPELRNMENVSSVGGGGMSDRRSIQQVLLFWKEQFCRPGPATRQVGLVVNPDPLSDEICTFEDAGLGGVYSSANHFWNVFTTVLNCVKLRLRVGEVIPVKKRQNLKPPAEEEEDGEDVDAVVHSAW